MISNASNTTTTESHSASTALPLGAVEAYLPTGNGSATVWVLPARALYWPAEKALILGDLHLGKATHFRAEGVYVPGDIIGQEMQRLNALMQSLDVEQVFLMGDLFHARYNQEWSLFAALVRAWPARWVLLQGNHDVLGERTYQSAGLEVVKGTLLINGLRLGHKPEQVAAFLQEGEYGLAGHVHPGYVLKAKGVLGGVKLPCFWQGPQVGILPAWGQFTGLDIITPAKGDAVYLIGERVWKV